MSKGFQYPDPSHWFQQPDWHNNNNDGNYGATPRERRGLSWAEAVPRAPSCLLTTPPTTSCQSPALRLRALTNFSDGAAAAGQNLGSEKNKRCGREAQDGFPSTEVRMRG
jgi:hypothetical protein